MQDIMSKKNYAVYNSKFIEYKDLNIHVSDLAFQRGFAIFDFFKVVKGKPIFLNEHLARFIHSAKELGLSLSISEEELEKLISQLLEKNDLPESGVKITLTGGYSKDAFLRRNRI